MNFKWNTKYKIIIISLFIVLFVGISAGALAASGQLHSALYNIASVFANNTVTTVNSGTTTQTNTTKKAGESPYYSSADLIKLNNQNSSYTAYAKPNKIRAAWLVAGVDYYISPKNSVNDVKAQIDSIFFSLKKYAINSVIVPLGMKDKVIYAASNSLFAGQDILKYMIGKARENGIFIYVSYNLSTNGTTRLDILKDGDFATGIQKVKDLCGSYDFDGIFFDDYYYTGTGSYADYTDVGGATGFIEYKREKVASFIINAIYTAKKTRSSLYTGITADPIWAKKTSDPKGFDTNSKVFEANIDGFADTFAWINNKFVNCVILKDYTSLTNPNMPFDKIAGYWAAATQNNNVDLVVSHAANLKDTDAGFKDPQQIYKQVVALKNIKNTGSAFYSVKNVLNDSNGTFDVIAKYFLGTIKSDYILKNLSITSPSKTTFTTYEKSFNIIGASDPNFPLKMNDKTVVRTELGYFTIQVDLKVGQNKIVLTHQGKAVTFNVNYKVVILKDISPSGNQKLDGGTQIVVTAVAHTGATVKAKLGGKTVNLIPQGEYDSENPLLIQGDFITFSGSFILPAGASSDVNLSKLSFTASYLGQTETKTGGSIIVAAYIPPTTTTTKPTTTTTKPTTTKLPTTIPTITTSISGGATTIPTTNVPTTTPPTTAVPNILDFSSTITAGTKLIAQVVSTQAETLFGNGTDDYSRPTYSFLPKGTLDYASETEIVANNTKYRKLNFGRRVYVSTSRKGINVDTALNRRGTLPATNTITASSVKTDSRFTYITLDPRWKAPYTFNIYPQSYKNPSTSSKPDYSITSKTFTYVDITFSYAVSGQGTFDFTNNPLFSKAQWIKGTNCYILRLTLKKTGGLYGYTAAYNAKGQLVFSFLHPVKIVTATNTYGYSLKGVKIMIDPGHGASDPGATGSNKNYPEAVLNLSLANTIVSELKKLGADTYLTRTNATTEVNLEQRVVMAQAVKPDMFISVHRNASTSTSATGYEDYYFNEFSFQLAKSVYDRTKLVFANQRGSKYYGFYVTRFTDCPSILTENGFVTNAAEYQNLMNSDFNMSIATSTVKGIIDYLKTIQ